MRSKARWKLRSSGLYDAGLLGRDDPVEVDAESRFEAANRSSSQFVMTPSRKRVLSRASAAAESGKAGQSATEPPNVAISSGVGSNPSSPATPRRPARQDVAIALVRAGLGGRLVPGVADEHVLVVGVDAVRREDRPERRGQAGLPVDERAVAVEGQGVEAP